MQCHEGDHVRAEPVGTEEHLADHDGGQPPAAGRRSIGRLAALLVVPLLLLVAGVVWLTRPANPGSWEQAWQTGDAEALRDWFAANSGPTRDIAGEVAGGEIHSQEDADRLIGKTVTGHLDVSCDCVLHDFVLQGTDMWVNAGDVTVRNVLFDGESAPDLVGVFTARGSSDVHLSHVEITGHHDGIRAYASSVTGEYVFIHGLAKSNPKDNHDDGIQVMGGSVKFDRSFIDMIGGNTSAILIKPDSAAVPSASINHSVLMGGAYTFQVHDGPEGTPRNVDLSGNLVAPGYSDGLVSTWKLTDPDEVVPPTFATVSGTGKRVDLVDGARL